MRDLGEGQAYGINDMGDVIGTTAGHVVVWRAAGIQDLGPGLGFATNNTGKVVGRGAASNGHGDAFLWDSNMGTSQDLGTLGAGPVPPLGPPPPDSVAFGVNNAGQVVGVSLTSTLDFHAFLYNQGNMTDLNAMVPATSGWTLEYAYSINDTGQIVGYGSYRGSAQRAFLLTPDTSAAVPEPASHALCSVVLVGLALMRALHRHPNTPAHGN